MKETISKAMSAPYRRELVPNADGTWFARVAELPGCFSEGTSAEDALSNLDDAMREWLRVQIEDGEAIPTPSLDTAYSGKFMVRVSTRLHREVAECAAREGTSLNAFVASVLARAVGDRTDPVYRSAHTLSNYRNAGISFMLDLTAFHAQNVASAHRGSANVTSLPKTSTAQYEQSRTAQLLASCGPEPTINLIRAVSPASEL